VTSDVLLAVNFRPVYDDIRRNLPSALLLTGADGIGLTTIARSLSTNVEELLQPQNKKGEIDVTGGSISVEAVRDLYRFTRGQNPAGAQIIIADADRMTKSAQQAFLKLLEEPPRGVSFILTSHRDVELLPTIRSRVQRVIVPPISSEDSRQLVSKSKLDSETERQLLFVAQGRPGMLTKLSQNPKELRRMVELVRDARDLVSGNTSAKLSICYRYNDRGQTLTLLDSAISLIEFSLISHPEPSSILSATRLMDAYRNIVTGGNVRLNVLATVL
jgi:DNA polymerase III, gamma/tau subunits